MLSEQLYAARTVRMEVNVQQQEYAAVHQNGLENIAKLVSAALLKITASMTITPCVHEVTS